VFSYNEITEYSNLWYCLITGPARPRNPYHNRNYHHVLKTRPSRPDKTWPDW